VRSVDAVWVAALAACSGSQHPTFDPPPNDARSTPAPTSWTSKAIYLVMPDRFSNGDTSNDNATGCFDPTDPRKIHGGDFAGLRSRIPYLQDLGVSAVWITPAYLQTSSCHAYHGYYPDYVDPDDGAIAPNLGDASALSGLIADLHAANIAVILDMVVNHTGSHSRMTSEHPDWFHDPTTCASLGPSEIYCPVSGLPDFAQENPQVAAYLSATSASWVTRFPVDGVRMDTVHNVLPDYWASSWFPAVRAASPNLFVIGEDFDESGASALAPFLDDGFDSMFDYARYAAFVTTFSQGGSVDAIATSVAQAIATYGFERALQMTSFVDNHDNRRLTSNVANATGDTDIVARFRLAQGASFSLPGIPELMWGDEVAMLGGDDPDNRRDLPTWAFEATTRAGLHPGDSVGDGEASYAYTKQLISIRTAHTALQRGSYAELWRQNGGPANVFAFFRGDGSDRVVVAINAGADAAVAIPIATSDQLVASDKAALADGTELMDLLGSGAPPVVSIVGGALPLHLPAQTMAIYVVH
jgi:glycosidase